jgi:hypothetical protein
MAPEVCHEGSSEFDRLDVDRDQRFKEGFEGFGSFEGCVKQVLLNAEGRMLTAKVLISGSGR